ncbi:MAG: hypothetical protein EXQ55_03040 [Acidobacteria bacterium]|nr:hypothetical protein [Acidobacteriota bacterium]
MCGFLCIVTRKPLGETVNVAGLNADVLRHRGPDSSGELLFQNAYVRHWRLSIVDLSDSSSQPYGDGSSWLIYNGEIYNYEALARRLSLQVAGDTPLLYELCKRGIERQELARARGFYSYLYLSENGLTLSGGRDPFGQKPLFYYVDNAAGIAVFASEEKAIVDCLKTSRIDFSSICRYLLYKSVFHGNTYFESIKQLAPGASFHFDARDWSLEIDYDWDEYYQKPAAEVFSMEPHGNIRGVTKADELDDLVFEKLRESLALRMPREVSACVALSGGIDSSVIAYLAASESLSQNISQFVTVGFQDPICDESPRAAEIAEALAITHKHVSVRFPERELLAYLKLCVEYASAPLEHPHYLSYYLLCCHASRLSKVLITGEGADELFMGYEHYRAQGASFAFREYLLADEERSFAQATPLEQPFDFIRRAARIGALREKAVSSPMLCREYELKTHLLSLLERNDKMGMANSVEVRAPFLDKEILGLCLALSDADLIVDGSPKDVLKRIFARCFPEIQVQGKKIGFKVPFDKAFLEAGRKSGMREYCEVAARALNKECGLRLISLDSISPRLGWSLLNIGVFLDTHGYTS